jgi:hypothetical protein
MFMLFIFDFLFSNSDLTTKKKKKKKKKQKNAFCSFARFGSRNVRERQPARGSTAICVSPTRKF